MSDSISLLEPWWLCLLATIPYLVVLSWSTLTFRRRNLDGGTIRKFLALGLRLLAVTCLVLALTEPRLRVPHDHTTVLFVLDRSASVNEEPDETKPPDERWLRVRKFINEAVRLRPEARKRDQAGLIVFGRRPRLELLPTDAPRLNLTEITSTVDGSATDIAAALQLTLASFPPTSAKRIVLLSDGSENRGSAASLGALARANNVQIDVVPLAAKRRHENEVLVARVEAPVQVEGGGRLPLKVWLRSYSPRPVKGTLILRQLGTHDGDIKSRELIRIADQLVPLGLTPLPFQMELPNPTESYTYEAEFIPNNLPGDRPQNNRASTHVMGRGPRRVLLLEARDKPNEIRHQRLLDALESGTSRLRIEAHDVTFLSKFPDPEQLTAWLGRFDAIVVANVSADRLTDDQQEALRSVTHDQGCGLVVAGGPESYGAGGWQNTPLEKALPVACDIKDIETDDRAGLVLIMHASEMAEGNMWQKKIAKLAIERLSPQDHVGVLQYGFKADWHIPMQEVGQDRRQLLRLVDSLQPGDMPDFDPYLKLAHQELTNPTRRLALKHVIVISDGDPQQTDQRILPLMRKDKVSVTTVGVATHGAPQDAMMERIAAATRSADGKRGRYYPVKKASDLPAIYIKETRLVSQSFVNDKPIPPKVLFESGPTNRLKSLEGLNLGGFVRTTLKRSELVQMSIKSPPLVGQEFPLLAYWQYGLGKSAAFTSDAGPPKLWCRTWAESKDKEFDRFWEQLLNWSLRPTDNENVTLTADHRDGRIRIVVEARTDGGKEPDLFLRDLKALVTLPRSGPDVPKTPELRFEQRTPGVYEAELPAEEAGSYFIGFQATRKRTDVNPPKDERISVRGSVTVPYAAEFADLESNPDLLEELRAETDGLTYAEDDEELARVAAAGLVYRPGAVGYSNHQAIWPWLVFAAALLLLGDVALRRLAIERLGIEAALARMWQRLRGRQVTAPATATLDRLQSRKAKVAEGLAARRFEPGDASTALPTHSLEPSPGASPKVSPSVPPQAAAEVPAEDYLSRLQRRKKQVWEQRREEPPPE